MSVREINYRVTASGISPSTRQCAGMQGEKAATKLVFTIDTELYQKMLVEKKSDDVLMYRFDLCNSAGKCVPTKPKTLETNIVEVDIANWLTRNGGDATVYLVLTCLDANNNAEFELSSYAATVYFQGRPMCRCDDDEESLTTLAEAVRRNAEQAAAAAASATVMCGKMEVMKEALESGSIFVFDGGNSSTEAAAGIVVDYSINQSSNNPVSNAAVAREFGTKVNKSNVLNTLSEYASAIANVSVAREKLLSAALVKELFLAMHPPGCIYSSSDPTDPGELFGGTWERLPEGIVVLSAGENYPVNSAGGEKEVALETKNMPKHMHLFENGYSYGWGADMEKGHANVVLQARDTFDAGYVVARLVENENNVTELSQLNLLVTHQNEWNRTKNTGGTENKESVKHNNLMPYIAKYVWERVS